MFQRTRRRLVLLNSAIIGAILLVMVALFYFMLTEAATRNDRTQLKDIAQKTIQEWRHHTGDASQKTDDSEDRVNISAFDATNRRMDWDFVQPEQIVLLTNQSGKVLQTSPISAERLSSLRTYISGRSWSDGDNRKFTAKLQDRTAVYALASYSLAAGGPETSGYVIAGLDVTEREKLLHQMRLLLGFLALALLALASGAGYVLAGRAMVPIREAFRSQMQFTADASHELRTPLTVLQTSVEILEEQRGQLPEFHQSVLSGMGEEISRMSRMTEQLLALARGDEGRLEMVRRPFELIRTARFAVEVIAPYARQKNISVELRPTASAIELTGDEERIRQLLFILLDNAIKYSPPDTVVTVTVAERQPDAVVIQVADTGVGIPAEDLPHIFERFYRVDKARSRDLGGTGLGLSIASGIAAAHGGTIEAASTPGEGSTFTVTLPKAGPR